MIQETICSVLILVEQKHEPAIVFWDHEEAYEDPNGAVTYACSGFTELINSLQSFEEED
jgi:hypothetical protein